MDDISETGIPVSKFLLKSNQGIGTFIRINDELVIFDDVIYQFRGDNIVREAGLED